MSACDICQRAKSDSITSTGLLQPLSISDQVWEDISIDFIEALSKVHGKFVVLVVVDRLPKYVHFVLSHPYTAKSVADIFIKEIARLYEMPKTIVCDRDRVFITAF